MMNNEIWLTITDQEGIVVERIDISKYNLQRPAASADLIDDIRQAALVADLRNDAIEFKAKENCDEMEIRGINKDHSSSTEQSLDCHHG